MCTLQKCYLLNSLEARNHGHSKPNTWPLQVLVSMVHVIFHFVRYSRREPTALSPLEA